MNRQYEKILDEELRTNNVNLELYEWKAIVIAIKRILKAHDNQRNR